MINISLDTDWAPQTVIDYSAQILKEYDVAATWFCTVPKVTIPNKHEVALHPNFRLSGSEENILRELLRAYPKAKGTRSHSVYFHTRLTELYKQLGLEYDSDFVIPSFTEPFWLPNHILEIPINYPDNYMFNYAGWYQERELWPHLNFSFHPVHIYLNTYSQAEYEKAKPYLQNPAKLWMYRNTKQFGTEDYLRLLLEDVRKREIPTHTLGEINRLKHAW